MYESVAKLYVFGDCSNISISGSSAWFSNNYFEGFSNIRGVKMSSARLRMGDNVYIRKGAARNNTNVSGMTNTVLSCSKTIFYVA